MFLFLFIFLVQPTFPSCNVFLVYIIVMSLVLDLTNIVLILACVSFLDICELRRTIIVMILEANIPLSLVMLSFMSLFHISLIYWIGLLCLSLKPLSAISLLDQFSTVMISYDNSSRFSVHDVPSSMVTPTYKDQGRTPLLKVYQGQ